MLAIRDGSEVVVDKIRYVSLPAASYDFHELTYLALPCLALLCFTAKVPRRYTGASLRYLSLRANCCLRMPRQYQSCHRR